jgi:hypothetical protein
MVTKIRSSPLSERGCRVLSEFRFRFPSAMSSPNFHPWPSRYTTLVISTPMLNRGTLNVIPVTSRTPERSSLDWNRKQRNHMLSRRMSGPCYSFFPKGMQVRGSARKVRPILMHGAEL